MMTDISLHRHLYRLISTAFSCHKGSASLKTDTISTVVSCHSHKADISAMSVWHLPKRFMSTDINIHRRLYRFSL